MRVDGTSDKESPAEGNTFYRLIAAQFVASVGDWLYKIALPLLVFDLTGSAMEMASTFALTFLPFLVFSLVGGVVADRYPRRRVLIICNIAAFVLLMLIAMAGGYFRSMPLVYVLVFLAASVAPIQHPSFQSFIPEVVSNAFLPKANSLVSSSENIISIAAPILSGLVVALIGPTQTIVLNASCFLVAGILVSTIRATPAPRAKGSGQTIVETIKEGFSYAWAHPVLKYGSLLFVGSNFAINIFQANLVFYLANILGAPSQTIGVVFAMTGVGAVIGALIAPWFINRFESGQIIVSSTILAGVFTFPLLWLKEPLMVGATWGLETVFGTINMVTYFTLRQRAVPKHILGRAVAITRLISYSSIPVAAFLGGLILARTNINVIILICASVRLATGLLATFSPLMRYRTSTAEVGSSQG